MRGSRAGVVAASSVGPMLNGVLSETVSGQLGDKDSSGMQGLSEKYLNSSQLESESKWTDESVAITESSEDGIERQRRVRRGKQAAIEAGASPVYDWTQALALQKPEVVENGTGASGHFSQTTSITATDETRESTALKKALHRQNASRSNIVDVSRIKIWLAPQLTAQVLKSHPDVSRPLPLQMTLYDGSHELPIMHAEPIVPPAYSLLILVVAVAYGGLKDPQCDADILNLIFKDHHSEYTYFDSISGENATFDAIEDAIGKLYREATKSSESKVLILLTGEGDEHNCMCLMDGKYITDRDLRRWMWKLQIDCYPKNRTVTIILDYCRTDKQTLVGSHTGVEFICSCSPGQRSAGLEFPNRKDIPRSCFLLALMMASHEPGRNGSDLVGSIDYELGRLSRLLEFTHKRIHEIGRCEPCLKGEPCPMPLPRPQHPDWQRSGHESIYSLVDSLSSMGIAAKVYDFFTRNVNFCRANGLPIGANILAPQPSLQTGTTQHNRGSSKPVQAAAAFRTRAQDPEKVMP
ncbi:ICE-like protease (caspase) p20 domain protein [Rhizoctonia solani]|uniref:ICE-like protease (Caspase) p20 domain protein n=1 Tax=Rhizoctonia solani TaxID=456999 RepID=A0A8H8SS50_9AGAM|nr:ICE-like protease (caspase) p20 domain protein [Rhizoctonia solani]QRW16436.1 ICE-like protease (caspase) p20 domain protein [Rhizoctonia solani]